MPRDDEQLLDTIFAENGHLSRFVPDYELRSEQKEMAKKVLRAYESDQALLVEAGTGVGKSWAYLIPAILWAVSKGESTVISTHTIALQEQLIYKDIPFLLRMLEVDLEAVLVKGMNNYLCVRKLEQSNEDRPLLSASEQKQFSEIETWATYTNEGSLSDLSFSPSPSVWDKLSAERSSCSHIECPHFKSCFFFKARKQMNEAKILIVNHHLLMADLVSKLENKDREEKSILPKFHRLVIDEAHHLEEIAFESFSKKTDRLDLIRWLGRLHSEHHIEKSRCYQLAQNLSSHPSIKNSLIVLLRIDIPAQKNLAVERIEQLFSKVEEFCRMRSSYEERNEQRWRLKTESLLTSTWQEEIKPLFLSCAEQIVKVSSLIASIRTELKDLEKTILEPLLPYLQEMEFIAEKLSHKSEDLKAFIDHDLDPHKVKWAEISEGMSNLILTDANLNVSDYLSDYLFKPRRSAILCSATLTASGSFSHLKERIGILKAFTPAEIEEEIFSSPFDYASRTLLVVPKDIPLPHESPFLIAAADIVCQTLTVSKGSALVLFTSYDMLEQMYRLVEKRQLPYPLFKQGSAPRQTLIDTLKSSEGNVLFATDSFWEGVDVPGEALRCVVLVKLPFKVPSEPLYQAISEVYEKEGKDPFMGYSVPQAALKFKQGFGRLMRKKGDRGCVICLDKRLMTKGYGSFFLKSIPQTQKIFESSETLFPKLATFYQNTAKNK